MQTNDEKLVEVAVETERRFSVLEMEMKAIQSDVDTLNGQHTEVIKKLDSLLETFTKYKGFVGGIIFTLSALSAALGTAISFLIKK